MPTVCASVLQSTNTISSRHLYSNPYLQRNSSLENNNYHHRTGMKYLDYPELESLSRALTFESAECKVFTRIEAYSCKTVKRERQLYKALESQYANTASISPPDYLDQILASPFGRLDHSSSRKTLFLFIATLNGAFPDHDFSNVNPSDFKRETSSDSVLSSLGTTLLSLRSNSNAPRSFSSFPSSYDEKDAKNSSSTSSSMAFSPNGSVTSSINHPQLASVLDDIMCIADCEVYSFHPDAESDPHACAEPEEEGDELNENRYADDDEDEMWNNSEGRSTTMSTPRQHDDSLDVPLFDEDLIGTGFTPASSQLSFSQPLTPRTPTSTRMRAGDFFSIRNRAVPKPQIAATSLGSNSSFSEEDDDIDGGLHGLLWATYTFFYNRKLKRILFVSVWSRRSAIGASYSFSPPSYPTMVYNNPLLHSISLDDNDGVEKRTTATSPAKRAIAKSTAKSRRRSLSSSPAPSSLSPFPHALPQGGNRLSSGGGGLNSPLVHPIQSLSISKALKQSKSSSSAPDAVIRSSASSTKRTVEGHSEPSIQSESRKHRKVTETKGPGKPLAA